MSEPSRRRFALSLPFRGKRPHATLLYVSVRRMARAECDARGCLLGEPAWLDAECRSAADLPLMVTDALRSGAPVGQRLWLWYDALPTHVLELPAAQVAGLRDAALHQALLFEAEQETGVDMARQQLAHILLGEQDGHCRYWITLAPEAALLEIQRVAARHGCGLAGLLHPGGLPKPLSPKAHKEDWARLEAWPQVLIGIVHRHARPGPQTEVFQIGSRQQRLQAELDRWQHDLPASPYSHPYLELLSSHANPPFLLEDAENLFLERDTVARDWLSGWATALTTSAPVPTLKPDADPRQELRLSLGLGAAALAICLLHFGWQGYRAEAVREESSGRKVMETRLQTLQLSVRKSREKRDELRARFNPVKEGIPLEELLTALRKRPALLLHELARNTTDGLILEEIHSGAETVSVKGVCLHVGEANTLAAALEARLHEVGWHVTPPRKKDMALIAGGGPWEFEITLMDAGLRGFAALQHPAPQREAAETEPGPGTRAEPRRADTETTAQEPVVSPPRAGRGGLDPLPSADQGLGEIGPVHPVDMTDFGSLSGVPGVRAP